MTRHLFTLPDVGEGLGEGEVLKWHVAIGDTVTADQIIVDVQTDKAIVEIPAPHTGVLVEQGGQPGDVLPIGAMLAVIESDGKAAAATPPSPTIAPAPAEPPLTLEPTTQGKPSGRAKASPATRKKAVELGVDLNALVGTGSRGQITKADVEQAASRPAAPTTVATPAMTATPPAPAPSPVPIGEDEIVPLMGLRRQIATTMEVAWRTVPHIFSLEEIDATKLVRARDSLNQEFTADGVRLSYLPFFVKACVAALKANPSFNASLDMASQQIIYRHRYNIGFATATPDGLIVPVIHDADQKSLREISQEIDTLALVARERKIKVAQLSHGTFTISNYGSYGAWMGTPIIRPPEVAIAGFGRIAEAVVPVDGSPAVRTVLPLVISTDHRLNDGEHLGRFMQSMIKYLADPIRLLSQ